MAVGLITDPAEADGILAGGSADLSLREELAADIAQIHLVGDAYAPRGTLAATSQGHAVGNAIG
jgi:hypothetical protein